MPDRLWLAGKQPDHAPASLTLPIPLKNGNEIKEEGLLQVDDGAHVLRLLRLLAGLLRRSHAGEARGAQVVRFFLETSFNLDMFVDSAGLA